MDNMNRGQSAFNGKHDRVHNATNDLLKEGKAFAEELYHEGVDKLDCAHAEIKEYSDELVERIRENPLKSVLIAGGIGLLLSALLKK